MLFKRGIMSKKSSPNCLKFLDNLSLNTRRSYMQTINKYESLHKASMQELVDEALSEQSDRVPSHQLKIIDRIEDFQESLIHEDLVVGTIKLHLTRINSVYRKNRVDVPYIEPINPKRMKRREYIEFKDILTHDEIRCCLSHLRPPAQARVMTIVQGGLSNEECEHLTLTNFIEELKPYHQQDDVLDALEWLSDDNHPVIWVTKMIRWKTKKPYYALIGAEAVNYIASAKLYEYRLKGKLSDKLLNTHKQSFQLTCQRVNEKCGLGLIANESKFRSHNLRRFHATYIGGSALSYEEHSIISNAEIDEMQGRGKTNVQDTYIKTNPIRQKLLYAKVMNNVSLFHKYDYEVVGDDVIITTQDIDSQNKKLKSEIKSLEKKLEKKDEVSKKIQKLKDELGDDLFREMIGEILNPS